MKNPSYRSIALKLEIETVMTCIVDANSVSEIKKKLSQAKHRFGIDGRLQFSEAATSDPTQIELTIVLLPALSNKILSVTKGPL